MAEPGAAKPAIQHKGSFRRWPHRAQARRWRRLTPAGAGVGGRIPVTLRHAGAIPVTLRHAGGARYPARPGRTLAK